ncbi:MAG TPA: M28 family peptidase [Saprospiraceae bacterium]|nr:M28 family peptidase [Saprospiraceae bacterium]
MNKLPLLLLVLFLGWVTGCKNGTETVEQPKVDTSKPVKVPAFNRDSAFAFVVQQVSFGPRVPDSDSHHNMQEWVVSVLKRYGATVHEQNFNSKTATIGDVRSTNIIASFNPTYAKRVVLAAHWDTRYAADEDDHDKTKPIDGADDGGSGVAILLEIARLIQSNPIPMGVDLVLFDTEDQGASNGQAESWCLGSQYWAKNPHVKGYRAEYGILLDMVGAKGAAFLKEELSQIFDPDRTNRINYHYDKLWELAGQMGHGDMFINQRGRAITDDHYFVNTYTDIPMIDIINRPVGSPKGFGAHWHTHDDNINVIDPKVLGSVGQVVTAYLYNSTRAPL